MEIQHVARAVQSPEGGWYAACDCGWEGVIRKDDESPRSVAAFEARNHTRSLRIERAVQHTIERLEHDNVALRNDLAETESRLAEVTTYPVAGDTTMFTASNGYEVGISEPDDLGLRTLRVGSGEDVSLVKVSPESLAALTEFFVLGAVK